jgi:hypothetical protein
MDASFSLRISIRLRSLARWITSCPLRPVPSRELRCDAKHVRALKHPRSARALFIETANSSRLRPQNRRKPHPKEGARQHVCPPFDQHQRANPAHCLESAHTACMNDQSASARRRRTAASRRLRTSACCADPSTKTDASSSSGNATEEPKMLTKNHFRSPSREDEAEHRIFVQSQPPGPDVHGKP